MIKELLINGKLYAKYELKGDHVFLKMIIQVFKSHEGDSEDWLISVIQGIEGVKITKASYLNI